MITSYESTGDPSGRDSFERRIGQRAGHRPEGVKAIHYSRAVADRDWPDELDALVASAEHHRLLLENERARVLETVIPPGETTEVHTHRWPNVQYVVRGSHLIKRDPHGAVRSESGVEDAETLWSGPIPPHTVENAGPGELKVIVIELKDPAAG